MPNRVWISAVLLPFLVFATLLHANQAPKTLAGYQSTFNSESLVIEVKHQKDIATINERYSQHLDAQVLVAKKKGDLALYKDLKVEKERFSKQKTIPEGSFTRHVEAIEAIKADKMRMLTEQYISALRKLTAALMLKDDIDEAEKVDAEIKRMEAALPSSPRKPEPMQHGAVHPEKDVSSDVPMSLKAGLVLQYDFDENEGKTVTDKSGAENHGRTKGARWKQFSGERRGVMEFDGKDDLIDVGKALLPLTADWSVALWLLTDRDSERGYVFNQYASGHPQRFAVHVGADGDGLGFFSGAGGGKQFFSVTTGKWTHIVLTRNDGIFRCYLDGKIKTTLERNSFKLLQTNFRIGGGLHKDRFLACTLDDVMIWRRALSEGDARLLYQMRGGKSY